MNIKMIAVVMMLALLMHSAVASAFGTEEIDVRDNADGSYTSVEADGAKAAGQNVQTLRAEGFDIYGFVDGREEKVLKVNDHTFQKVDVVEVDLYRETAIDEAVATYHLDDIIVADLKAMQVAAWEGGVLYDQVTLYVPSQLTDEVAKAQYTGYGEKIYRDTVLVADGSSKFMPLKQPSQASGEVGNQVVQVFIEMAQPIGAAMTVAELSDAFKEAVPTTEENHMAVANDEIKMLKYTAIRDLHESGTFVIKARTDQFYQAFKYASYGYQFRDVVFGSQTYHCKPYYYRLDEKAYGYQDGNSTEGYIDVTDSHQLNNWQSFKSILY